MDTKKTPIDTEEFEGKEVDTNSENESQILAVTGEKEEKKELSDFMALLHVVIAPVSNGPGLVSKHSAKAWCPAIILQSLMKGFFVLCFYHSLNQEILKSFVEFGNSISNGLRNMSGEMTDFIVQTVAFNISKIPFVGETISKAVSNYISDYLTLIATGVSADTNDLLYNLYPAIKMPEGIGFLMGVLSSLVWIGLSALVLKLFLAISKHPFQKFSEIFSLLSIRCIVIIPIVFVLAITSIFFPIAGAVLLPISTLYGMCYMLAVLFKSNSKNSENRFVYVLPLFIILIIIVSMLTAIIEMGAAGASIIVRLDAFMGTLQ